MSSLWEPFQVNLDRPSSENDRSEHACAKKIHGLSAPIETAESLTLVVDSNVLKRYAKTGQLATIDNGWDEHPTN